MLAPLIVGAVILGGVAAATIAHLAPPERAEPPRLRPRPRLSATPYLGRDELRYSQWIPGHWVGGYEHDGRWVARRWVEGRYVQAAR